MPKARSDWHHALVVLDNLRKQPPTVPVVLLLGDSLARESTVDDASWAAQVKRYGGGEVLAFNLGSASQTFLQSKALVMRAPRRALVFISVDPGRFAAPPNRPVLKIDRRLAASHQQHHYGATEALSRARKLALVARWVKQRQAVFKRRYLGNLCRLDDLIVASRRRGQRPVLLEMPLNMAVARGAYDRALAVYHYGCRSLAALRDIRYIDFTRQARLEDADFHDHAHMIQSGRVKWQRLLSKRTVALLKRYGMR